MDSRHQEWDKGQDKAMEKENKEEKGKGNRSRSMLSSKTRVLRGCTPVNG